MLLGVCAMGVGFWACGGSDDSNPGSPGSGGKAGRGGSAGSSAGTGGSGPGGSGGSSGSGNGGSANGGSAGSSGGSAGSSGGSAGSSSGGSSGTGSDAGGGAGGAGGASTDGGGSLCPGLGWCEITNTHLRDVCPDADKYPDIQANEGCSGVINDWSGGMGDTKRNRLLIWGGGHGGYFGNELYALDLNTLKMLRLNEPSNVDGYDFKDCYAPDQYPDGRPTSRHTYDALSFIEHTDQLWTFTGAKAPCGYSGRDTWTLDLASIETAPLGQAAPWTLKKAAPSGPEGKPGVVSDYDPGYKRVFLSDLYTLFSYDVGADSYTKLSENATLDYHMTGRVDPKRHLFIVAGGGQLKVFDIGDGKNHAEQNWAASVTGCGPLISEVYPGLAYDPDLDKMVGWAGGDTVYILDVDKKSCEARTFAGGPGKQNENGTMGRFRYFPALKVFAVVNFIDKNAYTLRLTP